MVDDAVATLERAFGLVQAAPVHYQALLQPVLLRAMTTPALLPFVELLVSDPHLRHILAGGEVEPFLPGELAPDPTQSHRLDVRGILADPDLRRDLMVTSIVAIQATAGTETTPEQALVAYVAAQTPSLAK
jgi:hypothetical protein